MFVTVGLLMSLATVLAYLYPRVRPLEEGLPDCVSVAATQAVV